MAKNGWREITFQRQGSRKGCGEKMYLHVNQAQATKEVKCYIPMRDLERDLGF